MDERFPVQQVRIVSPEDAPPVTSWLSQEIERWILRVHAHEVKATITVPGIPTDDITDLEGRADE